MGWVPTSIDGDHLPRGYSMLVYSMGASVDGFINDRNGDFAWTAPDAEQFGLHNELVGALGAYLCGRRLYEAMLVWETDPSMRDDARGAAFADIWSALPKVVFSHTLDTVQGNARLAEGTVEEEVTAALAATPKDVSIGGATLAAQAITLGLVDELQIFRYPVIVGGGTPLLPPVTQDVPLHLLETRAFRTGILYQRYRRGGQELHDGAGDPNPGSADDGQPG